MTRPKFPRDEVDFGAVIAWKLPLLRKAVRRGSRRSTPMRRSRCIRRVLSASFRLARRVCAVHGAERSHDYVMWTLWERGPGDCGSLRRWHARVANCTTQIECNKFIQFEFERQWFELKAHCARNEIRIMGDVPIYVALDSADVWADRELFDLDGKRYAASVAGVPPDYFSATGQLLGQPDLSLGRARSDRIRSGGSPASVARLRCST